LRSACREPASAGGVPTSSGGLPREVARRARRISAVVGHHDFKEAEDRRPDRPHLRPPTGSGLRLTKAPKTATTTPVATMIRFHRCMAGAPYRSGSGRPHPVGCGKAAPGAVVVASPPSMSPRCTDGGEAANWFSGMRANARRPVGPAESSALHDFARRGRRRRPIHGLSISQRTPT
jgi:hypothetical protein